MNDLGRPQGLRHIDLNLLVIFQAIYSESNLSRAAKALGLTQPAISNALRRLRDVYQDPLFVRNARGVSPTPKADAIITGVMQGLGYFQTTLIDRPHFNPIKSTRTFRIGMSDWMCLHLAPRLVKHLHEQAPQANLAVLNIHPQDFYQALQAKRIDLAISGLAKIKMGDYQQILYREYYKCIVWAGHPVIQNKLTLKQYLKFGHILISPEGKGLGTADLALKKLGYSRRIAIRVAYSMAVPLMLQNTDLIATIPAPLAHFFAGVLELKIFDPPFQLPGHDMIQYWTKHYHEDPEHQWFRSLVFKLTTR